MLRVKKLQEVKYSRWKTPKERKDYEIDVIFEDTKTKEEQTVRLPYGILKELYKSVKEEK